MVKNSIIILIMLVAGLLSACAEQPSQQPQDSCNKYSEPSLGVTFCAPPKWTVVKNAGDPYQKAVGEKKEGLVPTIAIISEPDQDLSLQEFVNEAVEGFKQNRGEKELRQKGYSSAEVESHSEFVAKTKQGYRIAYNAEVQGRGLRVIQYVFAGKGNTRIVVTGHCLPSEKIAYDKIFDDAMKTFEVSQ